MQSFCKYIISSKNIWIFYLCLNFINPRQLQFGSVYSWVFPIESVIFILLYLWAKYKPIWLDFTLKILSFSGYYLRQFFCKNFAQVVGTKTHCIEIKIQLYRLIFHPQVEENKCDYFSCEIHLVQNQEKNVNLFQQKLLMEEITY